MGPQKPVRTMTDAERQAFLSQQSTPSSATPTPSQAQGFIETSFTQEVVLRSQPVSRVDRDKLTLSWDLMAQHLEQTNAMVSVNHLWRGHHKICTNYP